MAQTMEPEPAVASSALRDAIAGLARGASIETSTRNLAEIDAYASMLPAGTDVYAAWLPGAPYHHIVSVAKRLRQAGMNPVPHIIARQLASRPAAADFLARLRDEAGVTHALVLGGDENEPVGPYKSSLALLESDLLQAHGIRSIGVAGYPEGHRRIGDEALMAALHGKIGYAARNGIALFVVSQFCFDARGVAEWLARLRASGVTLPVRVGVAGPASVRTLLNYGLRCGIGNSIRALGSQAISLTRLVARHGPEQLVRALAQTDPGARIAGLHFFTFGGFAQTARWIDNVAAGRFRLEQSSQSFDVPS